MKKVMMLLCFAALAAHAETITLECERFKDTGGWSIDSQFRLEMGSTYLLAHGMGVPVADAKTTFEVKAAGEYTLYARTRKPIKPLLIVLVNWTLHIFNGYILCEYTPKSIAPELLHLPPSGYTIVRKNLAFAKNQLPRNCDLGFSELCC